MSTQSATTRRSAPVVAAVVVLAGGIAAPAGGQQQPAERPTVTGWVRDHAVQLTTVDPSAPIDDVAVLRDSVGRARIVGLGESVHGAAEELTLKHRVLRFLVERMGFRTVAWEDDWTIGRKLDRYIRTGDGKLAALLHQAGGQWQSREVADVLRWLRDFNRGRADKVRFLGVEYYVTRRLAYKAVRSYVAETAPARLPQLRRHLGPVRPDWSKIMRHVRWYMDVTNKKPYVRDARAVYRLVEGLPHRPDDRAYQIALHHAGQIRSFYVHYALPFDRGLVYREVHAARSMRWWRHLTGDTIAYWAASPHVANAPRLRIVASGPDLRFPSAGSYLRDWYGDRYRSIGFTFDHGKVLLGPGQTQAMPAPKETWFEHPFGAVRLDQFVLDLSHPAPPPVRRWLTEPATTRGPAGTGPGGYLTGGSLRQWFDVIVHRQTVTPMTT